MDSGDTWNTSQIWSDDVDYENISRPITNLFNGKPGVTGMGCPNDGGPGSIKFSGISGAEVKIWNDSSELQYGYNKGTPDTNYTKPSTWATIYSGPSQELTEISWSGPSGANGGRIDAVMVDGSILVDGDGGTYNTLFQTWDEWATLGLFFFNENTGRTITAFELKRKYGLTAAAPDAGIYNLTFQPRARVFEYLKQATAYLPLEDLMPQLEATEASLVTTQADLDTAQAALNVATKAIAENLTTRSAMQVNLDGILTRLSGLESDEIVDDATDTTLLTAFAALVARVEALENP